MVDLLIYESGNGGEIKLAGGDLATTDSLANQIYLAHFGGNVEASTTGDEIEGEERLDWWGNKFFEEETEAMMNSELERALNNNSLSSSGRAEIERRANEDVEYLSALSDVSSEVFLIGNDKIEIIDSIEEIETVYKYLWDATKDELIEEITI